MHVESIGTGKSVTIGIYIRRVEIHSITDKLLQNVIVFVTSLLLGFLKVFYVIPL